MDLKGHGAAILKTAFDPTGNRVVTASSDRSARVWDAHSGRLLSRLDDHRGSVNDAIFTGDGNFLITASDDGKVRLWDTHTWSLGGSLVPRFPPASSVDLSTDRQYLIVAEKDNRARIYPWEMIAPLNNLQALAGARLKRQLTAEERTQYLPASGR